MKKFSISVIIVTYNSEEEIVGCLDSVFHSVDIEPTVYVVDNNSQDRTVAILQSYATREPRVKLILNNKNVGLAAANNQPLAFLNSQFTLVLNPDIILTPDAVKVMAVRLSNDSKIGMIGPLCLFGDGAPHKSSVSIHNFGSIVIWRFVPHSLMRLLFDSSLNPEEKSVLFVSGACYLIPTDVYRDLKGYDPAFFLSVSDVADIGVRLKGNGFKALYFPQAVITHFSGRSNAPLKLLTQYWGITGDLFFLYKHKSITQFKVARWILATGSTARCLFFQALFILFKQQSFGEKSTLYRSLAKHLRSYDPTVPVVTTLD